MSLRLSGFRGYGLLREPQKTKHFAYQQQTIPPLSIYNYRLAKDSNSGLNSETTRTEMYSSTSPRSPITPRSVDPVPSPAAAPDPNDLASLLTSKGHHPPTYDSISRESTPRVVADAKEWIQRIDESISCLSATFAQEEWRQKNILNDRYWKIEADHWELYYHDSLREKRQEEDLKNQQARHNIYFFQHTSQFDWHFIYTQLSLEASVIPEDEIYKSVCDIIYHRHRATYWQGLCKEQGYTQSRKSIQATNYWRVEFGYLNREISRLEKGPIETGSRPTQKKEIPAKKNISSSSSTSRHRGGGKKGSKTSSIATGIRKSKRLEEQNAGNGQNLSFPAKGRCI